MAGIFGPAIANGIAYFGADNHNLYALDANTGVVLWQYLGGDRYQAPSIGGPTVANGTLFSTSSDRGRLTGAYLRLPSEWRSGSGWRRFAA